MKTETKILIFLLFLPPALGELITGSSPPLLFFNPIGLLFLVLLYGCGTLLIREAKVRWKLQWSVIFLAVAYGILEEGTLVQSFFNPGHEDLGVLSMYGVYFGVQLPWAIMLILFHATMSTLIPIAITELTWPEYRDVPILKKRGIILSFIGIILFAIFWTVFVVSEGIYEKVNYHPDPSLIAGSCFVVILLIWLAYKYKNTRISTSRIPVFSPFVFVIAAFLFQALNLFTPSILAEFKVAGIITIAVQFILIVFVLLFLVYQIYHINITKRHIVSLISGSILFFILLTPVNEFVEGVNPDPAQGMFAVGIISLILLIIWRRNVLKNESS